MLLLAQSLQNLAKEASGEYKAKILSDAQSAIAKVSKGRHAAHFKTQMMLLTMTLDWWNSLVGLGFTKILVIKLKFE